jgi:uncharacterized coiled-coil protein SlyX
MTTLPLRKSIDPATAGRAFLLIPLALTFFALSPMARAVDPPPDGGYPNQNTAENNEALQSLTSSSGTAAVSQCAICGSFNTATGLNALSSNTNGVFNTANGVNALFSNTSGQGNTANGFNALKSNTTGDNNTATGIDVLSNNTIGYANTASGSGALAENTTGSANVAEGDSALARNTSGVENTATGFGALVINTTGNNNTADGASALSRNTTGSDNIANGAAALKNNTTGSNNIAIGKQAGLNLTTGSGNIVIGSSLGAAGDFNKIRIGKPGTQTATFIAGIRGVTVASGIGVIIGPNGQLGTVQSSARYKEAIQPMDRASEALLALKPVTFHYKPELDPDAISQFGLLAEDVEKVNPDLVVRDADGKVNTVRYEAVNAMLLNEFLKEHRKVEEQQATITGLESKIAKQELIATGQQKQIETLTATVREVSDQIALSKPSPQFVANP